ncbi:MAG: PAS domain S-box protein [Candidatus Heimdallarchaeota archaeon]
MLRILLIDDDEDQLLLAKNFLAKEDPTFEVITARSAQMALQTLEQALIDAVVVDYSMPDMDGIEFLQKLRLEGNWVPFIMFTGRGHEKVAIRALNLGANYYLTKSVNLEQVYHELAEIIRNLIQKKQDEEEERLRGENALRESEKNYLSTSLDSIEDGYYEVDLTGKITFFNNSARRIFGYAAEEMLGLDYRKYMDGETAKSVFQTFNRVYRTGEPTAAFDHGIVRKDGSKGTIEISVSLMVDSEGRPEGFRGIVRDTTARKKMELDLRDSEEKYHNLIENVPVGISVSTPEGEIIDANTPLLKMLGYDSKEEFLKTAAHTHWFDPKDREKHIEHLDNGVAEGFDSRFKRKDGSVFWGSTKTIRQVTDSGILFLNSFQDITKRKNAEEALRDSEQKFRELADLLPQTVFELDLEGNVTFANRFGLESSGYTQEDIDEGLTALQLFIPEERARLREAIQIKMTGKSAGETEYTALRKDGSKLPVLVYSSPIIRNNQPVGLRGIALDITDLKRAENALRESEKKYRSLVETSPDGIAMTDLNGTIYMVNQQCARMAGYKNTETMAGKNIFDFFGEKDRKRALGTMRKLLSFGSIRHTEFSFQKSDGTALPADLSSSLIVDENGLPKHYMMVIRDISERRRAEESFRNQRAELSEFANAMAQELRSHLLSMEGYMRFLTDDPPSEISHVERILHLIKNMNELLEHLVVLADAGLLVDRAKIVNLGELVPAVAERVIPGHIAFSQENLPAVLGDSEKLARIFQHLFENAVIHGKPSRIMVKRYDTDGATRILVSNDGTKISPARRHEIFQRGYTTHKGRLGLGLAIAQRLVEAHGWKITLEISPETTFRIAIPLK